MTSVVLRPDVDEARSAMRQYLTNRVYFTGGQYLPFSGLSPDLAERIEAVCYGYADCLIVPATDLLRDAVTADVERLIQEKLAHAEESI